MGVTLQSAKMPDLSAVDRSGQPTAAARSAGGGAGITVTPSGREASMPAQSQQQRRSSVASQAAKFVDFRRGSGTHEQEAVLLRLPRWGHRRLILLALAPWKPTGFEPSFEVMNGGPMTASETGFYGSFAVGGSAAVSGFHFSRIQRRHTKGFNNQMIFERRANTKMPLKPWKLQRHLLTGFMKGSGRLRTPCL